MPNIQFNASDEYYFKHKNLPPDQKRDINDKLRKLLYRELDRIR